MEGGREGGATEATEEGNVMREDPVGERAFMVRAGVEEEVGWGRREGGREGGREGWVGQKIHFLGIWEIWVSE